MRAVGLVTEYNPFHNGHLHHLRESLKISGADVSVAVISGHYLQRGMPALVDKWLRTEMALASGVDIIFELPVIWACNSAPHFADGAIQLLTACGGIQSLCFGSEEGSIERLRACTNYLVEVDDIIKEKTATALKRGIPYPSARAALVGSGSDFFEILSSPNNILGISYLQSLDKIKSPIRPMTIHRIGAGYHDCNPVDNIASASGIRRMISQVENFNPFVPEHVHHLLRQTLNSGNYLDESKFFTVLAAKLMDESSSLRGLYLVDNGIAEHLCCASRSAQTFSDLIDRLKVRHLTMTRIQRILCSVLLNFREDIVNEQLEHGPSYLRLLGASHRGEIFLGATRKERSLPVIGNLSRASKQLKKFYGDGSRACSRAEQLLQLDTRATRIYTHLLRRWSGGDRNRDYFEKVRRHIAVTDPLQSGG